MSYFDERYGIVWKNRIAQLMRESGLHNYSQFARALVQYLYKEHRDPTPAEIKKYTRIARWEYVPKLADVIEIADFFKVDIGYLLGETDDDTFDLERASAATGLRPSTLQALQTYVDGPDESKIDDFEDRPWDADFSDYVAAKRARDYRVLLDELANSYVLAPLLRSLLDYQTATRELEKQIEAIKLLQSKMTEENLSSASYQSGQFDEAIALEQEKDASLEKLDEIERYVKSERYEAIEQFARMLDDVWPNATYVKDRSYIW